MPDLAETVVLHRLGLLRSDDLPDLAARWLAADLADGESVRQLAGHDPHDPWGLEHCSRARCLRPGSKFHATPTRWRKSRWTGCAALGRSRETPGGRSPPWRTSGRLISTSSTSVCSWALMLSGLTAGDVRSPNCARRRSRNSNAKVVSRAKHTHQPRSARPTGAAIRAAHPVQSVPPVPPAGAACSRYRSRGVP